MVLLRVYGIIILILFGKMFFNHFALLSSVIQACSSGRSLSSGH